LCSERSSALSGYVHESVNIEAAVSDMDIKVEEMSVVKVEADTIMDIKEEEVPVVKSEELTAINVKTEIPWDVTSPKLKVEEDHVSYVCFLVHYLIHFTNIS
jgi:hypothetical protein